MITVNRDPNAVRDAFDLNPETGGVTLNPVLSWTTAIIAGGMCGAVRLEYMKPPAGAEKGAIQLGMVSSEVRAFGAALLDMADRMDAQLSRDRAKVQPS